MKGGRGFSLVELLVVLAVGGIVVGGLLALFQAQVGAARRQIEAADLQQAARIGAHELARACRAAGRGGVPASLAIAVRNNVAPGERSGGPGTPALVPGSDVLVVRGVFEGSSVDVAVGIEIAETGALTLSVSGGGAERGALGSILEAARERTGEALLLTGGSGSPYCRIVEISGVAGETRDASGRLEAVTLEYRTSGSAEAEAYRELASTCETGPPGWIRRAGLLEEHRFYVRRGGVASSRAPVHRLARARFLPGTDRLHRSSTRAGAALVDHVLDLQVALGSDLNGDGLIGEGSGAGGEDEWLFDRPGESAERVRVDGARLSLLLRAARPIRGHRSAPLDRIEDRVYRERTTAGPAPESRSFQRRLTTTLVRRRG